jgi:hypothetical protein
LPRRPFTKERDANGDDLLTVWAPLAWDRVLERLAPEAFAGLLDPVAPQAQSGQLLQSKSLLKNQ